MIAMNSSDENIRHENELINILIGLCFPRPAFPNDLYNLGYRIKGFEKIFNNINGNEIKPDMIIACEKKGCLIFFESKSGKNVEKEQIKNYSEITKEDLIRNAGFNKKLLTLGHDISYICYEKTFVNKKEIKGFNNLLKGIKGKYNFPILVFDKEKSTLSLKYFTFKDDELTSILSKEIKIPMERLPTFIKFDQHSSEEDIEIEVLRSIISYIQVDKMKFTIGEMLSEIISPFPGFKDLIGPQTKKSIKNKLKKVLKQISKDRPDYFTWNGEGQAWIIDDKLNGLHYNQLEVLLGLVEKIDINDNQLSLF